MSLFLAAAFLFGQTNVFRDGWAGLPVDISESAYHYYKNSPNNTDPESWIALAHVAHLPLNKPIDQSNPAIKLAQTALLWEEIRPVQTIRLSWGDFGANLPSPSDLKVDLLVNRGSSSSWWNNLETVELKANPTSPQGFQYQYSVGQNVCGVVVSYRDPKKAEKYGSPSIEAFVPDTWKKMDVEVEWGFAPGSKGKDFSGYLEAYDGRIDGLKPLSSKTQILPSEGGSSPTISESWRSTTPSSTRRGVKMSLYYMGTSKWRKIQGYTTQPDDVARTIVTVWTNAGNFSFLAADLENGPIYAPEYGFFVRRTSPISQKNQANALQVATVPLMTKMDSVVGNGRLKGWGSDATPIVCANPTDETVSALGITFPPKSVSMHPGQYVDVVAEWRSPIKGMVRFSGSLTHAQAGSNGIEWFVCRDGQNDREILAKGVSNGTGTSILANSDQNSVSVQPRDRICLVIGPKGNYNCDTNNVDWTISEVGGKERVWNLAKDVADNIHLANPHPDGYGNSSVWTFASEMPTSNVGLRPSEPPIELASKATSGAAYLKELKVRNLKTIREQTRLRQEQTWKGAVTTMRGQNLPPIPEPPAGTEPSMQVDVPSPELNAQWKLGAWHLLRHCAKNPTTGKLWFNDFPYGILAAETYLVLDVLDLMGAHEAAADGLNQWVSLPLQREHPVGNFADGFGVMSNAIGPDGYGGQMDTIHAFGPGSIGWALSQHYWLSGDKEWLKASAPRIKANAEWMLRQRQVVSGLMPGGSRLWCKGLQPALQVTPDSGGLWIQFYECEAYYWSSISRFADTLTVVDHEAGTKLKEAAEAYRKDLRAAVERSIALSPVVPVRDGTFHSVIPFACYCRGLSTGAWGWMREGSGNHVGPLYWDTVQSAAALVSPAGLLPANDPRVQGYLDVLEDRVLLENQNAQNNGARQDWMNGGWQYQGGLERTANMHLAGDDIPVFLRSFFNCYAVDILPKDGYIFNEHAVHGPPDKIFEEAAFLERFRNLLVMEEGKNLWLAKGTPRAWLEQGKRISVKHAPTHFGEVDYEVVSDVNHGRISATVTMPTRGTTFDALLRLRHPKLMRIASVKVNGKNWKDFDPFKEVVRLHGLTGTVKVEVHY